MDRFGEADSVLVFILSDITTVFSVVWMGKITGNNGKCIFTPQEDF